jgi:hypothetical protein
VIAGLRQRLRLSAEPGPVPATPAPTVEPARELIEIELAAYGADCRIFGFVLVDSDRLTDYLNERETYELRDVFVVALEDGRASEARTLTVERGELLAVRASGPRGSASRRGRTRPYPVTLQTGPYTLRGHLHGLPGGDPIVQLRRRRPMVALTESWIEYPCEGECHRGRVGTIIFNRELIDWIHLSQDGEIRLPDLPLETRLDLYTVPQAKDLTGYIWTTRR